MAKVTIASSLLWMTSVLMTCLTINPLICETVSVLTTGSREAHPQKMVEIIELMLPQRPNNSDQKGFGIQRVPQERAPNYEILITPNKNLPELKGSQKIKIFVETSNYDPEGKTSQEVKPKSGEHEKKEKSSSFEVLPLSIETVGLNLDQYQRSRVPNVKGNNHHESEEYFQKDFESYPSKRQTNWQQNGRSPPITTVKRQQEVIVQREPSYVDQNNPYQPVSALKIDDRPRGPSYDSDYSSSSQNGKRIPQQTYVNEFSKPVEGPIRPQNRPTPKRQYETTYEEKPVYEEVRPVNDRKPAIREPEVRPSNDRRPTIREPEEVRSSNDRRSTNDRRAASIPVYSKEQEEDYRPAESQNPAYNERRPSYGSTEGRQIYGRESEEVRPGNDRYPEYEETRPKNPAYVPDPPESKPPRRQSSSDYDKRPQDGNRPVRENSGYSGFPESYQTDINNHYSQPLQYEATRVFPASPCPNVFKYEGREPEEDRWYADIYVTTDEVLNGMRLDIRLDRPAETLSNWIAETKTKDSTQFTLLSLTHKLVPGPPETVKIMVKFNRKKPVPYLKTIFLNGRSICPSPRAQKTTTRRPVYENPGDLQTRRTTTTTEAYREVVPNKPLNFGQDYESNPKRTTDFNERVTQKYEESVRKTTVRPPPPEYAKPNPNGFEETDQNTFNVPTKRPPGRPAHSNGKPPPHAAKPAQGNKPNNGQGQKGQGHGPPGHSQAHGQGPNKNSQAPSNAKPVPNQSSQKEPQGTKNPIQCGTPSIQPRPLITHGQLTSRGQWPWHVALYKNVGTDLNFFCGGSLINMNHVVTAAHCVTKAYTTKPLDENSLVVYLGKYHLKLWSEGGVQNRQVSKIYVHPKYNSTDFRADIAVLALSSPVDYTDYVRPICMWDRSRTRLEDVEGKEGTVIGWGFDETKQLTEELRQAKMPVVEQKTCLWSYPEFFGQFTSNLTFCAGYRNGTSVCNGDSGGGMVFPYKDNSGVERWHLRGIVSISSMRSEARVCDPTHYAVFTDAAKFLPWLENFF